MMLEWEEIQRKADELKAYIEAEVLAIGKTQTVGNVRATYSAGRKSYDYEIAWMDYADHTPDEEYSKIVYDYCAAAIAAELTDILYTQSPSSVAVRILA